MMDFSYQVNKALENKKKKKFSLIGRKWAWESPKTNYKNI